jgi:transposase
MKRKKRKKKKRKRKKKRKKKKKKRKRKKRRRNRDETSLGNCLACPALCSFCSNSLCRLSIVSLFFSLALRN